MNSLECQLICIKLLTKELRIKYAVLGGLAVALYGEPRMTLDIDVVLILPQEVVVPFLAEAKKRGFYPIPPHIVGFAGKTGVIPARFIKQKARGRCDFIIAQTDLEMCAINRARSRKIGAVSIKVVTPEDLLIHKIISERPRDLEDVRGIIIRQGNRLDKKYISLWLKKIAQVTRKPGLLRIYKGFLRSDNRG